MYVHITVVCKLLRSSYTFANLEFEEYHVLYFFITFMYNSVLPSYFLGCDCLNMFINYFP